MKSQWSPSSSIESLYKKLKEGKDFAQQGNKKTSESHLVRYIYTHILATSLFVKDYSKWQKKATADQT